MIHLGGMLVGALLIGLIGWPFWFAFANYIVLGALWTAFCVGKGWVK